MKNFLIGSFLLFTLPVFSQATLNNALSLNGSSDKVALGMPFSSGTSYTREAWINPSFASNAHNIESSFNAPFWIGNGKLQAGHAGNYSVVVDPNPIPINTWTHVAVTYDAATGIMKLYRNGLVISSATVSTAYTAENTFIGSHEGTASFFQGKIDELRNWSRALTQQEIRQNMFKGPETNAPGLLQYFKCNQNFTGQLNNSVPSAAAGICTGGSFVTSSIQFSPNGLHFDGTNDYIEAPASPAYNVAAATVECWMKPTVNSNMNAVLFGIRGTGVTRFSLHVNTSGNTIGIWNGTDYRTVPFTFTIGQWYHIAYSIKATSTDVYVNGNLVGTATAGMSNASNLPLRIGVAENYEYFTGVIDEVRFWNHNRTAAQIQGLMNTELDPSNSDAVNGLVAYYTFDQGIADGSNLQMTTALDQVSSNHGTLYNFALTGTTSNFVTQNPANSALPLKIISFDVRNAEGSVRLNWMVDLPQDGTYLIQQSTNGQNWKTIGDLASSAYLKTYSFIDHNPEEGNNYYRVEHIDADGKLSYSDTKLVRIGAVSKDFELLHVRNKSVSIKVNRTISVSVFNSNGNVVTRKRCMAGAHTIDLSNMPAGVFILHSGTQSEKIIIK